MSKRYPHIADDHRQPIVPRVANVIPRTGAWSGDNQLGTKASYAPDRQGKQTILKLDEWGPPDVWTISLGVDDEGKIGFGFRVTAEINFGVGGATQTLQMDWLNGAEISLPMNAVNVVAIFNSIDPNDKPTLNLSVQLARGRRGGNIPPRLTLVEDALIGDSDILDIPPFAKYVVAVPTASSDAGYAAFFSTDTKLLTASGTGLGAISTGQIRGSNATVAGELRLPVMGSARLVRLLNNNVGATYNATLFAELDG